MVDYLGMVNRPSIEIYTNFWAFSGRVRWRERSPFVVGCEAQLGVSVWVGVGAHGCYVVKPRFL